MIKNRLTGKITAVLLVAALIFAQNCFVFAAEDSVSEDVLAEEAAPAEPVSEDNAGDVSETAETAVSESVSEEQPAVTETAEEETVTEETEKETDPVTIQEETEKETDPAAIQEETVKETDPAAIQEEDGEPIPVGAKINMKGYFGIDGKVTKCVITSGQNLAELKGVVLTAKKPGNVTVKLFYKDYDNEKGEEEETFTVYPVGFKKNKIVLNDKSEYDATENLKANSAGVSPSWSSSVESVAKVDPSTGKVTVLTGGSTVISASYPYGNTEQEKVCKFKLIVKLPGLKFPEKKVKLGGVFFSPLVNVAKDTEVSWTLDANETRAEWVDQNTGKIRLIGYASEDNPVNLHVKAGTEELTAKVTTAEISLGGVPKNYEERGSVVVRKGKTRQFSVKGIAKGCRVEWSSSDDETVSVSKKGLVKAKDFGYASVTATVEGYGDLSVDIEVPDPSDV